MKIKQTKDKVTGVRIPPDLLAILDAMAHANERSLSNQIIKLLRDAVSRPDSLTSK